MTDPIRLVVVDDHTLFRRGLIALLSNRPGFSVVGEAGDGGEALRRVAEIQPDVILLDHHLPGASGLDVLESLRLAAPAARVLMLTISESAETLTQALQRGACGYLLKTADTDTLVSAIERAFNGQSTISAEMTDKLVGAYVASQAVAEGMTPPAPPVVSDPLDRLSPRERQILREIALGASNKEVARTLGIAETTIKIHVQHILRKLNLTSRVQAAVMAAQLVR